MSKTDPKPHAKLPATVLREAGDLARDAGTLARDAGNLAREGVQQARRKGRDVLKVTREKSEAVIAATREKGEAVIDDTRDKTMRAAAETNRLFQEHPIAAVAAATAAGAILGIFLPRLNITGRAGQLAGKAIKAAVANETTQRLLASAVDAGKGKAKAPAKSQDDAADA